VRENHQDEQNSEPDPLNHEEIGQRPRSAWELLKLASSGVAATVREIYVFLATEARAPLARFEETSCRPWSLPISSWSNDQVPSSVRLGDSHARRRRPVHFAVTAHPTSEWTSRQLLEAFPRAAQLAILRDRDGVNGEKFHEATEWLGIHEVLTTPKSPRQNLT